ncbi:undecaprenyl-diphosphatase [Enhydrobacter aerosaccus]|uniref:Undecaprenyl-diphosphatase n=1 Tax=Enhydrobacter aerosaccus TaxID=225324 RepID=A0A1T4TBY0_9HYPH|nr:phosphatase PAP2 family protein [Enhydrobacter aerosaccus]SKA37896.1 undecaprenyl-diphosphatase [Enhydrobacter aerosaccus]
MDWAPRDWDRALLLWINQPAGHNGVLDKLVFDIADATLIKGGLFLAFYWWLWFDRTMGRRRDIVVALTAALAIAILSRALQVGLPFHQRPLHTPGLGLHVPLNVDPESLNTFSSFPSDHAMLFFALAVPIWARSRWLGAAAMVWTLLLICLPRVYLGYHFPSDVLAGAGLGILLMLVLCPLIAATRMPDRVLAFKAAHPAAFYALAFVVTLELAILFYDVRHFVLDAVRLGKMLVA